MSFFGNLLWLVFGGFFVSLGYFIGGLGMCLTIVGIPFGMQAFKLAGAHLTPFGKDLVRRKNADSPLRVVFNIIWAICFGWEIAIAHLAAAAVLAVSVVGLPWALQHLKLIPLSLFPFGTELR